MYSTLRTRKARGELTEIRFLLAAASCGFIVCKPWGESQPFDFIVYCKHSGLFYRVQVKHCSRFHLGGYAINTRRSFGRSYNGHQIDFVAAYVIRCNAWYIIPVRSLGGRKSIYVYPHTANSRGMFNRFREAWQLLRK